MERLPVRFRIRAGRGLGSLLIGFCVAASSQRLVFIAMIFFGAALVLLVPASRRAVKARAPEDRQKDGRIKTPEAKAAGLKERGGG